MNNGQAADGPTRVMIWCTPRCLSTAFLKAMTYVEDAILWHEPYLYARRMGPDGADRETFKAQMMKIMEQRGVTYDAVMSMAKMIPFGYEASAGSYQWVKEQLEADAPGKKLIFVKDMVEGVVDRFDTLPSGFRHTFLVRHPLKVLPSFKKLAVHAFPEGEKVDVRKLPEFGLTPKGFFYKELSELYHYIKDNNLDTKPVIICTDDLQKNPEVVLRAYCKELNIAFTEKLLKWEDDSDEIVQKWMIPKEIAMGLKEVHKNAFESKEFGEPSPLPDKSGLDEDLTDVIKSCMPYYEELYQARLQVL